MSALLNAPFNPTRAVVLCELGNRDKGVYYNILANNGATFSRDSQGRIVANVRLLAANTVTARQKKVASAESRSEVNTLSFEERLKRLRNVGTLSIKLEGVTAFDYASFPRFASLIAVSGEVVRPRMRAFSWLMKLVEDAYDARFAHEKMDVERDDEDEQEQIDLEQHTSSFPVFVVRQLSTLVGLKNLVDQTCWDLLYNAQRYRSEFLEVEIFMRFLQEFYDQDDLLFFLYVRAVVARTLHISFKRRWAKSDGAGPPKALWMSYREATLVSKAVFGSTDEQMHKSFLHIISTQVVGQKGESTDSRRIEISQFLHLAVVAYHQYQSDGDRVQGNNTGGGDTEWSPQVASDLELQDYHNIPEDAELAKGLESDFDQSISMSTKGTPVATRSVKKLVPQESNDGGASEVSPGWNESEAWGEGGYYDDGVDVGHAQLTAGSTDDAAIPDYLNSTGIENNVWESATGSDQEGVMEPHSEDDEFSAIQLDRENEFMAVLIGSLDSIPEEVVHGIQEDLLEALRVRLSAAIQASPVSESPDQFDDLIVSILSSDEFVNGMVEVRDSILESHQ